MLRDPFTGVNAEDELEPLNPTRTIINVGPSAYPKSHEYKLFMTWDTYTDLAECCDNYTACVRPRKSEHEDRCDTVERPRFDEDPEDGEAGCTNPLRGTMNSPPEPISDQ